MIGVVGKWCDRTQTVEVEGSAKDIWCTARGTAVIDVVDLVEDAAFSQEEHPADRHYVVA